MEVEESDKSVTAKTIYCSEENRGPVGVSSLVQ